MSSKPDTLENVETPLFDTEEIVNSTPFEEEKLKNPSVFTEHSYNSLIDNTTFFTKLCSSFLSTLNFILSVIIIAFNSILVYIKKFPYRGTLNFMIMVLIAAVIVLHTQQKNPFLLSHLSHFVKIFLDENESTLKLESDGIMGKDLFSIADVLADVNTTVQNYYSFVKSSPDTFVYLGVTNDTTNRTEIMPIKMTVNLWSNSIRGNLQNFTKYPIITKVYDLTLEHPLGFFSDPSMIRSDFDRLADFTLYFDLQSLDFSIISTPQMARCIQWSLTKRYENENRGGKITAIFEHEYGDCENVVVTFRGYFTRIIKPLLWLAFILFCLSIISIVVDIYDFIKQWKLYYKALRFDKTDGNFLYKVMKFLSNLRLYFRDYFSLWLILSFVRDISNILATVYLCFVPLSSNDRHFFLGLGGLAACIVFLKHYSKFPRFYAFVSILKRGFLNIFRFLLSALPLFLGYAVLGCLLFGHYDSHFQTLDLSMVNIFSIILGDSVRDAFAEVHRFNPILSFIGRIYIMFGMIIFTWTCVNIFLLTIQDAYFVFTEDLVASRTRNRSQIPGIQSPLDSSISLTVNDSSTLQDNSDDLEIDEKEIQVIVNNNASSIENDLEELILLLKNTIPVTSNLYSEDRQKVMERLKLAKTEFILNMTSGNSLQRLMRRRKSFGL